MKPDQKAAVMSALKSNASGGGAPTAPAAPENESNEGLYLMYNGQKVTDLQQISDIINEEMSEQGGGQQTDPNAPANPMGKMSPTSWGN